MKPTPPPDIDDVLFALHGSCMPDGDLDGSAVFRYRCAIEQYEDEGFNVSEHRHALELYEETERLGGLS